MSATIAARSACRRAGSGAIQVLSACRRAVSGTIQVLSACRRAERPASLEGFPP